MPSTSQAVAPRGELSNAPPASGDSHATLAPKPPVFARLTPHNAAAYKAFRAVVDAMKRDPAQLAHHRRFLHYDEPGIPLSSLLAPHHSASPEVSGGSDVASSVASSDQHTQEPPEDDLVFNGHYLLSLDISPAEPTLGWVIGTGRRRGSNVMGGVDILLNSQPPFEGVRSRHAALTFHKDSGILAVESCHRDASVTLDMVQFTRSEGMRGLTRPVSFIQFGDLLYRFAYTDWAANEELIFQKRKESYFAVSLSTPAPIQSTSATPSLNAMVIGNWNLHRTVGGGAFGIVNAASRLGGKLQVVAFKAMVRSDYFSDRNVDAEFLAALNLKKATENHEYKMFIIRMKEAIYERGSSVFDYSGPERVYFIYSPLARGTFGSHILNDLAITPMETRILLLADIIKGLTCLHDVQWIHRDIKPDNLAVVTMSPPRAVILDIGQACFSGLDPKMPLGMTRGIQSTPGKIGTPLYSPPEMAWELSRYGPAADIYSLGLVAYQLFVGPYQINPWLGKAQSAVGDEYNRWEVMCTSLRTKGSSRIEHLISEMLAFDMDKRCSARQALGHPSLKQNIEPDHKRAKT